MGKDSKSCKGRSCISNSPMCEDFHLYTSDTLFNVLCNKKRVLKQNSIYNKCLSEFVFRCLIRADRDAYRSQFMEILSSKNSLRSFVAEYYKTIPIASFREDESSYLKALGLTAEESSGPYRYAIQRALRWLGFSHTDDPKPIVRVLTSYSNNSYDSEKSIQGSCFSFEIESDVSSDRQMSSLEELSSGFVEIIEKAESHAAKLVDPLWSLNKFSRFKLIREEEYSSPITLSGRSGYLAFLVAHYFRLMGKRISPYVAFSGALDINSDCVQDVDCIGDKLQAACEAGIRCIFLSKSDIVNSLDDIPHYLTVLPYPKCVNANSLNEVLEKSNKFLPDDYSDELSGKYRTAKNNMNLIIRVQENLKDALEEVGNPEKSRKSVSKAIQEYDMLKECGIDDAISKMRFNLVLLSDANNRGASGEATKFWVEIDKLREAYSSVTDELDVELIAAQNRRGITFTDLCYYDKAENQYCDLIDRYESELLHKNQSEILKQMASLYGSIGQLYAYIGSNESRVEAMKYFYKAIDLFKDKPAEKNREWNYLGNLACDMGRKIGSDLWKEVITNRPALGMKEALAEPGKLYTQILQIKGKYIFSTPKDIESFLKDWEHRNPTELLGVGDRECVEYCFILQGIGMLHERLIIDSPNSIQREEALKYYEKALNHIPCDSGEFILEMLRYSMILRKMRVTGEFDEFSSILDGMLTTTKDMVDRFGELSENWMLSNLKLIESKQSEDYTGVLLEKVLRLFKFQRW